MLSMLKEWMAVAAGGMFGVLVRHGLSQLAILAGISVQRFDAVLDAVLIEAGGRDDAAYV